MTTQTYEAGEGRLRVRLDVTDTGNGLSCLLTGGTHPHVGGHALAAPGPELHGEQLSRVDLWTATVPGHKDAELAAAVARELCLACGKSVSVTCGVHVDDATPDDIQQLAANALSAARSAWDNLPGNPSQVGQVTG